MGTQPVDITCLILLAIIVLWIVLGNFCFIFSMWKDRKTISQYDRIDLFLHVICWPFYLIGTIAKKIYSYIPTSIKNPFYKK
jgi:hypothetical protein